MARSPALAGDFHYRHPIEIRYGDTDALGHVNNAVYFAYFEMARGGYYTSLVGHPFGTGPGAERRTYVIAEAHIHYREPVFYGEPLAVAIRVGWVSRSAFAFDYQVEVGASAIGAARMAADGSTVQVFYDLERSWPSWRRSRAGSCRDARATEHESRLGPGAASCRHARATEHESRLGPGGRDGGREHAWGAVRPSPAGGSAPVGRSQAVSGGREHAWGAVRPSPGGDSMPRADYASKERKTATAFWPPKPKPLTMAVSTLVWRATLGT
jgi:acyl-CoA thioester hydrolase